MNKWQSLTVTCLFLGVLLIILGLIYGKQEDIKPESSFDLNPTPKVATNGTEPVVTRNAELFTSGIVIFVG